MWPLRPLTYDQGMSNSDPRRGSTGASSSGASPLPTRYQRHRVILFSTYGALSLLSLLLAFTGGGGGGIDAEVRLIDTGIEKTLSIKNLDGEAWQGVSVTLPGGWEYSAPALSPGEILSVQLRDFRRVTPSGSERAPRDMSPPTVTVSTVQGRHSGPPAPPL